MKTHSDAFLRRRKFLLVLPLLVLPFLTLAFWALGGGRGTAPLASPEEKGFNLELPAPQLPKAENSKLGLYRQAGRQRPQPSGSTKFLQRLGLGAEENALAGEALNGVSPEGLEPGMAGGTQPETQEEKIQERLTQLTQLVTQDPVRPAPLPQPPLGGTTVARDGDARFSAEVSKLEKMMRTMGSPPADDPEMARLEGLLERILDIQHPERLTHPRPETAESNTGQRVAVRAAPHGPPIDFLHPSPPRPDAPRTAPEAPSGFYSLPSQHGATGVGAQDQALAVAVHETQKLAPGATVKLRLLQDVFLGGRLLPAGSLVYGTCQLRGERLAIGVTSIRAGSALLPVSLTAYDLDGMAGLRVPGTPVGDAARQGAGRAIGQSLQLPALSPSLGAQAASAGLDAARGLLSKQARQVTVTLPAGYRLLLLNQQATR